MRLRLIVSYTAGSSLLFAALGCSGKSSTDVVNPGSAGSAQAGSAGAGSSGAAGASGTGASGAAGAGTSGAAGASGTGAAGASGAGTSGSSGSAGSGTAGAAGSGSYRACVNPMPVIVNGKDSGFVSCSGGVVHRAAVVACPNLLPRTNASCTASGPGVASDPCMTDADCSQNPHGFCTTVPTGHFPACGCVYGCLRDADCAAGQLCECGDPVGVCRDTGCADDSACPAGSLCASAASGWGGCSFTPRPLVFACETSSDGCLSNQDCSSAAPACGYDTTAGARSCGPAQIACP